MANGLIDPVYQIRPSSIDFIRRSDDPNGTLGSLKISRGSLVTHGRITAFGRLLFISAKGHLTATGKLIVGINRTRLIQPGHLTVHGKVISSNANTVYWLPMPTFSIDRTLPFPQYILNVKVNYLVDLTSSVTSVTISGITMSTVSYDAGNDRIVIASDPGSDTILTFHMVADTTPIVLQPPANLITGTVTSSSIALDWADNPATPQLQYQIYRSPTGNSSWVSIGFSLSSAYTDSTVTSGVTYFYQVTACTVVNSVVTNQSAVSNTVSATATVSGGTVTVATLNLTAPVGGTLLPFTVGQVFKQGDVPLGQFITSPIANFQADIRNRWLDGPGGTAGSVKFAVLSGRQTLTSNVASTLTIQRTPTAPAAGTNLTEANLIALAPTVSVAFTNVARALPVPGLYFPAGTPASFDLLPMINACIGSETVVNLSLTNTPNKISAALPTGLTINTGTRKLDYSGVASPLLNNPAAPYPGIVINLTTSITTLSTVTLSFGSPMRTSLGTQMSEFHYRFPVGTDAHLAVFFYVKLYTGNFIEIETCLENGHIMTTGGSDRIYTATLTIGGTTRYTGLMTHYYRARWMTVNWYDGTNGLTDFTRIIPTHDVAYIKSTKIVPNYSAQGTLDQTMVNGFSQAIVPMGQGNIPSSWDSGGYSPHIGMMPEWDASHLITPDARTYKSVIANAYAVNTWSFAYRDENTQRQIVLTDWNGLSTTVGGGGFINPASVPLSGLGYTDSSHSPNEGFLAYLLTGRWTHFETLLNMASASHLAMHPAGRGSTWPTNINDYQHGGLASDGTGQDRTKAWHLRTVMLSTGLFPDPGHALLTTADANVRTSWVNALNTTFPKQITAGDLGSPLGYIGRMYNSGLYGSLAAGSNPYDMYASGWQMSAISQCFAWASDFESFLSPASRANLITLRDWYYKYVVGIMGDPATGWSYRYYNTYKQLVGTWNGITGTNGGTFSWLSSWGVAYARALLVGAAEGGECLVSASPPAGTDIRGTFPNPPGAASSQTAFPIPALSFAVDHNAPGASQAWQRLIGSSTWNQFTIDQNSVPEWSVRPRSSGLFSYTTTFSATESPISEGGIWVNGAAQGTNWQNVRTTGGNAYATGLVSGYNDDIAHLSTAFHTFNANQFAQATVFRDPTYAHPLNEHEIELLLRFSITGGNARGYEVTWGLGSDGRAYLSIVRWNGPLGNYTTMYALLPPFNVMQDGDVFRAWIIGNLIHVSINGVEITGTFNSPFDIAPVGNIWATGQPGFGFWPNTGATLLGLGYKDFTAGDM